MYVRSQKCDHSKYEYVGDLGSWVILGKGACVFGQEEAEEP